MERRTSRTRRPAVPEGSSIVREAKLFMNGRSQAVRLPADCRFEGDAVYAKKWRGVVILLPKDDPWKPLRESLGTFSADFMAARDQSGAQGRPGLDTLFDAEE